MKHRPLKTCISARFLYGAYSIQAGLTAKRSKVAHLHYMTHRTELGLSLFVTQDAAVIFHHLGEDEMTLLTCFTSFFPLLTPTPMPLTLCAIYSRWVDGFISGKTVDQTISLSFSGTPFQQKVWRYLMTIPRGVQRSYFEVAQAVGYPKAVRAVASACARNQIALAIPCHRVVRADGSLSGYRWGVERKKWLLERESANPILSS